MQLMKSLTALAVVAVVTASPVKRADITGSLTNAISCIEEAIGEVSNPLAILVSRSERP